MLLFFNGSERRDRRGLSVWRASALTAGDARAAERLVNASVYASRVVLPTQITQDRQGSAHDSRKGFLMVEKMPEKTQAFLEAECLAIAKPQLGCGDLEV